VQKFIVVPHVTMIERIYTSTCRSRDETWKIFTQRSFHRFSHFGVLSQELCAKTSSIELFYARNQYMW